ncbi:MAG TPA: glycosyltransferase [Kiritimatiellia bacterium]|nr:glycosyltransferase [Kiritimatiellia bacterium]HMP35599.1 glycosyltransferase [Kiritimatiellia bacterium]
MKHLLITNTWLQSPGGTEGIVRDLTRAWHRRGDRVTVYSPRLGAIADALRAEGIAVTDTLASLSAPPDLIHGHHNLETMTALLRFPGTPALYHCHGYDPWQEQAPRHPRILRYLAISDRVAGRVHEHTGLPRDHIHLVFNYADPAVFRPHRDTPAARPARAVIYDRYLNPDETALIQSACLAAGITCTRFADLHPPVARPEDLLPHFDLVFAVGKSAIEAMACGAAVILCTGGAMGELVTGENAAAWQRRNFTAIGDHLPVTTERVAAQLAACTPERAAAATAFIREHATFASFLRAIDAHHDAVLRDAATRPAPDRAAEAAAEAQFLEWVNTFLAAQIHDAHVHRDARTALAAERDHLLAELRRTTAERDHATAQRDAITATTSWRLRTALLNLPVIGSLLERLGRRAGSTGNNHRIPE